MIVSDRRPVSNRCPLLKSASTDVIISNHGPIIGYSQTGVLSKLSYLLACLHNISLPSKIIVITVLFFFVLCLVSTDGPCFVCLCSVSRVSGWSMFCLSLLCLSCLRMVHDTTAPKILYSIFYTSI